MLKSRTLAMQWWMSKQSEGSGNRELQKLTWTLTQMRSMPETRVPSGCCRISETMIQFFLRNLNFLAILCEQKGLLPSDGAAITGVESSGFNSFA